MKMVLGSLVLALTTFATSALADRYECYPTYQVGGGDTRRIVINIDVSRLDDGSEKGGMKQWKNTGEMEQLRTRDIATLELEVGGSNLNIVWYGKKTMDLFQTIKRYTI